MQCIVVWTQHKVEVLKAEGNRVLVHDSQNALNMILKTYLCTRVFHPSGPEPCSKHNDKPALYNKVKLLNKVK